MRTLVSALAILLPLAVAAQSPSVSIEELRSQIDAQVSGLEEYRALLNDPDPVRSQAALRIMLASGDAVLERMALETGLFAADIGVRRATAEYFMASQPSLIVRLDGSKIESAQFQRTVTGTLKGALGPENQAAVLVTVGEFSDSLNCYTHKTDSESCAVSVGAGEIFVQTSKYLAVALSLDEQGLLSGFAKIYNVSEGVPASVKILE